jgi:hypothetical protein
MELMDGLVIISQGDVDLVKDVKEVHPVADADSPGNAVTRDILAHGSP